MARHRSQTLPPRFSTLTVTSGVRSTVRAMRSTCVAELVQPPPPVDTLATALPSLPFEVSEAARLLRTSRARFTIGHDRSLKPQKDGAPAYKGRTREFNISFQDHPTPGANQS